MVTRSTGTVLVAVRKGLTDALAASPVFAGVDVQFAFRAGLRSREKLFTTDAAFTHSPASLRQPRTFRNEAGSFTVVIVVEAVAGAPLEASQRAADLGHAVEDFVADHANWTDGALGVVLTALTVSGDGELFEAFNDKGALAELRYPIRYTARLE